MAETPLLRRRLTRTQRDTLLAIQAYQEAHGYPPTMREMQHRLSLGAVSSAFSRLETLRRYGLVDWQDGQFRTLRLTLLGLQYVSRLSAL